MPVLLVLSLFSAVALGQHDPPPASTTTGKTKEVVIGEFKQYSHPSGWFTINIPSNWTINDQGDNNEAIVTFADPTKNGILVIRVWKSDNGATAEQRTKILSDFVNARLSSFPNFSARDRDKPDRSGGLFYKYDSVIDSQSYAMYVDSFIEKDGGKLAILGLIFPQEQYNAKKGATYRFVNSFRLSAAR